MVRRMRHWMILTVVLRDSAAAREVRDVRTKGVLHAIGMLGKLFQIRPGVKILVGNLFQSTCYATELSGGARSHHLDLSKHG